jgi:hypothetical protein
MVVEPATLTFRERWQMRRLVPTLRRGRDPAARQGAAGALATIGGPRAAEALADAARDDNKYVRSSVLGALAQLDAKSFADLFRAALNDPAFEVQQTAIEGLTAAGDRRFAADVAVFLDHPLHSMRRTAANALHHWEWATDDGRRARVALAREAWTEVTAVGADGTAEVIKLVLDDRYWSSSTSERERDREQAVLALEQLVARHAAQLSDADLLAAAQLEPFTMVERNQLFEEDRPLAFRRVDLSGLRRLCVVELERRASRS